MPPKRKKKTGPMPLTKAEGCARSVPAKGSPAPVDVDKQVNADFKKTGRKKPYRI